MSGVLDGLLRNRDPSEAKSYFVGLERGRIWAQDSADYFEMRQWSEERAEEFDDLVLPGSEERHFKILMTETRLEWEAYLRGWIDGVRQIRSEY